MKHYLSPLYSVPCKLPVNAHFVVKEKKICSVTLHIHEAEEFQWQVISAAPDQLVEAQIASWIKDYCSRKEPKHHLPISLQGFPPYTTHVLEKLRKISFGHTLSYKELAEKTSNPKASRAVGSACGRNPCLLVIPCHRVLASNGSIGGFAAGIEIKELLLNFENNTL